MDKSKLACAIWPWGTGTKEEMELAAKEVTEIGYHCFESVKAAIYAYELNAESYREVLKKNDLKAVSFYFHIPPYGQESSLFDNLKREMEFLEKLDVHLATLQGTGMHPEGDMTKEQLEYELELINRFAQTAAEFSVTTCLHPHDNTWVMYEPEISYMFDNSDPALVAFNPDTAHLVKGNCDPAAIIEKYVKRVKFTHLKDVKYGEKLISEGFAKAGMEIYSNWLEMGKGDIDFSKIFGILKAGGYDGYLCTEMDKAPVSNYESAKINFDYVVKNY